MSNPPHVSVTPWGGNTVSGQRATPGERLAFIAGYGHCCAALRKRGHAALADDLEMLSDLAKKTLEALDGD